MALPLKTGLQPLQGELHYGCIRAGEPSVSFCILGRLEPDSFQPARVLQELEES